MGCFIECSYHKVDLCAIQPTFSESPSPVALSRPRSLRGCGCGGDVRATADGVEWHRWAPGAVSAFPRPEQPNAAPVPRDHSLRLDNVNGRPPAAPRAREPHPQPPVFRREAKTWAPRSMDDGKLVSDSDDFQVQQGARPDQEAKGVKERDDDGGHDCRLSENVRKLN
jgi:hypothetical protein